MFGIEENQQDQGGPGNNVGDQWVGRVMSAEYNLAVQRRDPIQAGAVVGRMFGEWLNRKYGG
jgi:hypothetical protein